MSDHASLVQPRHPRGTLLTAEEKESVYAELSAAVDAVVTPGTDSIAAMASCAALVHQALPYASWTGFYRVVAADRLAVGPYQGPLGCLEIPFSRGVCGAAARERRTQVVADVEAFPGHIACDAGSRSEIVVPWIAADGTLLAVLDVDSHREAAFDEVDARCLEMILRLLASRLDSGGDPRP
jgi:L-methionine (R)-S-oxide reductase